MPDDKDASPQAPIEPVFSSRLSVSTLAWMNSSRDTTAVIFRTLRGLLENPDLQPTLRWLPIVPILQFTLGPPRIPIAKNCQGPRDPLMIGPVVELVLEYIYDGDPHRNPGRNTAGGPEIQDLANCVRVCKLWFKIGQPILNVSFHVKNWRQAEKLEKLFLSQTGGTSKLTKTVDRVVFSCVSLWGLLMEEEQMVSRRLLFLRCLEKSSILELRGNEMLLSRVLEQFNENGDSFRWKELIVRNWTHDGILLACGRLPGLEILRARNVDLSEGCHRIRSGIQWDWSLLETCRIQTLEVSIDWNPPFFLGYQPMKTTFLGFCGLFAFQLKELYLRGIRFPGAEQTIDQLLQVGMPCLRTLHLGTVGRPGYSNPYADSSPLNQSIAKHCPKLQHLLVQGAYLGARLYESNFPDSLISISIGGTTTAVEYSRVEGFLDRLMQDRTLLPNLSKLFVRAPESFWDDCPSDCYYDRVLFWQRCLGKRLRVDRGGWNRKLVERVRRYGRGRDIRVEVQGIGCDLGERDRNYWMMDE